MIICPNCGTELSDTAKFCRKCGTKIEDEKEEAYDWGPPTGDGEEGEDAMMPVAFAGKGSAIEEVGDKEGYGYESVIPEWDHTHEFEAADIAENKVLAMAAYILGPIGIIIALLAAKTSPYVGFHVRQGTKFLILEAMMLILAILMCWSTVLPVVASIVLIIESIIFIILVVLKLIAFVSVCRNKAVEPPVIRSLWFMK